MPLLPPTPPNRYVPYVGDSKRALDEYTSEIFLGGKNTIVLHNTCEDSLLAAPIILDLIILAELITRIELKKNGEPAFHGFHPIAVLLSYLTKVRRGGGEGEVQEVAGASSGRCSVRWCYAMCCVRSPALRLKCSPRLQSSLAGRTCVQAPGPCWPWIDPVSPVPPCWCCDSHPRSPTGSPGAPRHTCGECPGQAARNAGEHHARLRGAAP